MLEPFADAAQPPAFAGVASQRDRDGRRVIAAYFMVAQALNEVKPVHGGKVEVAYHGVGQQPKRRLNAFFRVGYSDDARALRLQQRCQRLPALRVVFDKYDRCLIESL